MASLFSSFFSKKEPDNAAPQQTGTFPTASFSLLQGEVDGKSIMGSVNKGYKNYGRRSEFPWCLHIGIALAAENVQTNGLPKDEEIDIAYKQEDELVDEIKRIDTAHFIGHIFNDGYLDVYLYLAEPKKVHDYLQTQINKPGLLRAIGYEISKDEQWDNVEGFLQ